MVPNTWTLSIMGNGKSPKTKCTLFFWNLLYIRLPNKCGSDDECFSVNCAECWLLAFPVSNNNFLSPFPQRHENTELSGKALAFCRNGVCVGIIFVKAKLLWSYRLWQLTLRCIDMMPLFRSGPTSALSFFSPLHYLFCFLTLRASD